MNCFSCNEEISERFKHALSQNVCPFCGKAILSNDDHYFRVSLSNILRRNGIQDSAVENTIIQEVVVLLNSEYPEGAQPEVIELPSSGGANVTAATVVVEPNSQAVKVAAPTNKKPPKKLNFRSSSNDPLTTKEFTPPSESMDMADIESEIGQPTPEEIAEIEREIANGEIVFKTLS